MSLDRRRVLLTGATGGLGRAIARALHARGAIVVATGRREDALEKPHDDLGHSVDGAEVRLALERPAFRLRVQSMPLSQLARKAPWRVPQAHRPELLELLGGGPRRGRRRGILALLRHEASRRRSA